MKKYMLYLVVALFLVVILANLNSTRVYARLGGGSSSGGSGGSSSSAGTSHYHSSHSGSNSGNSSPIESIIEFIFFIIFAGFSGIIFKIKIINAKIHSKQLMRILDNKDDAWKYENVQKQVEKAYFILQKAWTNQEMDKAKEYISKKLYDRYQSKIEWMQIRNQKNILKKISLIDASPISINDDEDDSKDYIWYYIKGSMIDYTIDVDTKEIVDGEKIKTRFIEYWKFCREDKGKWVLCEILQEDEKDQIIFN